MDDQPTCGKGLAEHSALPETTGRLIEALAEVLEVHQMTLVLTDQNARKEHEAYVSLAKAFRNIASRLHQTAQEMASHRDLPMGKHDEAALMDSRAIEVFARYVKLEDELSSLLQRAVERDQNMLAAMREFT